MVEKYKLNKKDAIVKDGVKLYRIISLIDIPKISIKEGSFGGYVSDENCLSHSGYSWIFDGAFVVKSKVLDNALVMEGSYVKEGCKIINGCIISNCLIENGAVISGEACVHTNSDYEIEPIVVTDKAIVSGNILINDKAEILGGEVRVDSDRTFVIGDCCCLINAKIDKPSDLDIVQLCEKDGLCECQYKDVNGIKRVILSNTVGLSEINID